jgi:hypothetical protein
MLGVMGSPVTSRPVVILAVAHIVTSRFSATEYAAEAKDAARTEHSVGAERTARSEERTSGRGRWR